MKFATELAVFISIFILAVGCTKKSDKWTQGRPPVYPTHGQVLLDGEPVEQATVTFQPVDPAGKGGYAVTDAEGMFKAQTFEPGDGLTEGKHKVKIQKTHLVDRDGKIVEVVREPGGIVEKNFLPKKYAKFETSDVEIEVTTDENEIGAFNLTE